MLVTITIYAYNDGMEPELQQLQDLLRSEQSKTEKLQGFLEHAEKDVEEMSNQLDKQKALVASLEQEKVALSRQLSGAKTGLFYFRVNVMG